MPLVYVHLSDIHFGQEKGGQIITNNDVKDQIVLDVRSVVSKLSTSQATGIIISGDIAFAGKEEEYKSAGIWLDRLAAAVGCDRTAVQMVPGNHDIDLELISAGAQTLTDDISNKGDAALDKYLENDQDRELLYHKFIAYRTFAAAYGCPLDQEGSIHGHKIVEVAEGRYLKFYGVNTALTCSKSKTEEGKLLLGQRQRVISPKENTEIIVIAHHPLHWLQDSEDARRFIINRARMFISGHEHKPTHKYEKVTDNADLLSVAAGATSPPKINADYNYCYNIIEFEWIDGAGLRITLHPRIWNDETKSFAEDNINFKKDTCIFTLNCPNFSKESVQGISDYKSSVIDSSTLQIPVSTIIKESGMIPEKQEQLVLLRFFRDLTGSQRLQILVEMAILPSDVVEPITHNIEVQALKAVFLQMRTEELQTLIDKIVSPKIQAQK